MACTDVAKVKAKAMVINLIICSSNVNLQDFRAAITALAAGREYELIPHNQSGPDDAARLASAALRRGFLLSAIARREPGLRLE